jgi:hypothetical protein
MGKPSGASSSGGSGGDGPPSPRWGGQVGAGWGTAAGLAPPLQRSPHPQNQPNPSRRFVGITWRKARKKWISQLQSPSGNFMGNYVDTQEEAARQFAW